VAFLLPASFWSLAVWQCSLFYFGPCYPEKHRNGSSV
jgi:hypothetical protein